MFPLPHMQLPDATEHPQTWRHVTEGGLYAPHTVPTGMPSSHFEAVPTTAPADLSLSISPVTKGMLNLSTNVTAPPQAPQDTSQQGAFYLPGEDEHYIQSSMTSPYSEVPSVGHYVQLAYTPSAGQPSPLIGQMGQHPPHDYFADYQSVLYEEAARSAPHHHTAPPISTGSTSEQAVSGKNRSRKASAQASKTKRQTRQYQGVCNNCQKHFATVTLRGLDADFSHPYFLQYYCMTCAPNILAVKPMSDIEASKPDEKQKGKFNKKRIRPTDPSSPATCDVCLRPAAYGGPVPLDLETELTFHTEVVCDHCTSRYARCSDCGGGGGARCGVGKWRCRELFSEGRKTCSLNHSRQSNVSSMQYSTMRIRDVSHNEMPEIMTKCQRVFQLALLSTLAVPEVLERGTANASTFADVQDKVEKGWEEACRVFKDDKEESEGLRRYLGVRWSAPKPRKTAASTRRSPDEKAAQGSSPDLTQESATPDHIIMPGMNVAGFVTAEWSMYEGTIFVSISVPYTTGEQYEGAAHLINMLQTRAHRERDEMLADFDAAGRHAESASIPPIKHTFTMIFFTPDSKYMAFLESKRQLLPLERYLAKYPETNPDIFPPRRKTFMSDERAAEMTCIVRHLHSQESDGTKRSAAKASARSSQQRNSKQAAAS